MPSPDPSLAELAVPVPMHVERTDDARTARWVVRDPAWASLRIAICSVPAASALGALVASGEIDSVCTTPGAVLVRAGGPAMTPELAARVDAALHADVHALPTWPLVDDHDGLLEQLRHAVRGASGELTARHGGRIEVVGVDTETGTLTVRLDGACHGCALSGDTVERLVAPAARRVLPGLQQISVAAGDTDGCGTRRRGGLRLLGRRRSATAGTGPT